MTMKDVLNDHGLDVRYNGDDSHTATCPVCMSRGLLQIKGERFQCHNRACRAEGDAYALDRLYRNVRADSRLR